MKKTILTVMTIMFISSVSLAKEANSTTTSYDYELVTFKANPLCMAIVKGDLEAVKKMIEFGNDVNEVSEGMTPLMYAARYNRLEIIKVLVEKGAKIKTKNRKGYNAIKFAEISNAKEAVALLKELS
ncbi:ankyrin repeat domain-containing protein [Aquimarina pacifica]|uniref:ankyrin repeat domain-containing protein n=1 Tax=Aquimarina pacifica TaxID=1296415 RepID=UPI000471514B|nr:ankyrin repeat domain-containing protein [Aquimarina pacifica]